MTKIKIISSLPTKKKVAATLGATDAEIEAVERMMAKAVPILRNKRSNSKPVPSVKGRKPASKGPVLVKRKA